MVKFLQYSCEHVRARKRSSNRWAEPEEFLERLQKVDVERIGFWCIEASYNSFRKGAIKQALFYSSCLFLKPVSRISEPISAA
jgi:hypothetical protein